MTKSVCFIERNFILDIEWSRTSKRNEAKVLSLSLDSTFLIAISQQLPLVLEAVLCTGKYLQQ